MENKWHKKTEDFDTTHKLLCGTKYGYWINATKHDDRVECKKCLKIINNLPKIG